MWNAARTAEYLGVSAMTVWGYASKGLPKGSPFPDPEPDPAGLVVADPGLAVAIRLLMAAASRVPRGQDAAAPPRLWRASQVRSWDAGRKGRGNWRT